MIDLEKKTTKEKLVSWYETLDPSKRKQVTLIGGGAALFVIAAILIIATSDDNSKSFIQKPRKVEYTLFNGKSPQGRINRCHGRENQKTDRRFFRYPCDTFSVRIKRFRKPLS